MESETDLSEIASVTEIEFDADSDAYSDADAPGAASAIAIRSIVDAESDGVYFPAHGAFVATDHALFAAADSGTAMDSKSATGTAIGAATAAELDADAVAAVDPLSRVAAVDTATADAGVAVASAVEEGAVGDAAIDAAIAAIVFDDAAGVVSAEAAIISLNVDAFECANIMVGFASSGVDATADAAGDAIGLVTRAEGNAVVRTESGTKHERLLRCWGATLSNGLSQCAGTGSESLLLNRGSFPFRSRFCATCCRDGFDVPTSRVRSIRNLIDKPMIQNSRTGYVWNVAHRHRQLPPPKLCNYSALF